MMDWSRVGSNSLLQQVDERESLLENEWIDTSAANLQILRRDESSNLKISKYCSILNSLISIHHFIPSIFGNLQYCPVTKRDFLSCQEPELTL